MGNGGLTNTHFENYYRSVYYKREVENLEVEEDDQFESIAFGRASDCPGGADSGGGGVCRQGYPEGGVPPGFAGVLGGAGGVGGGDPAGDQRRGRGGDGEEDEGPGEGPSQRAIGIDSAKESGG